MTPNVCRARRCCSVSLFVALVGTSVATALGQVASLDWTAPRLEPPPRLPRLEAGYGQADFPVAFKRRRTQLFFDQGMAMLHGFAPDKAERAFQMVLAMEPELPAAWLGLALANLDRPERAREFTAQAVSRRGHASKREQAWIDALQHGFADSTATGIRLRLASAWKGLFEEFPDDIAARALFVQHSLECRSDRPGSAEASEIERQLKHILAINPDHAIQVSAVLITRNSGRDTARAAAQRACRVAPQNPHVWTLCGEVCAACGDDSNAVAMFEQAIRLHHRIMRRDGIFPDQSTGYADTCEQFAHALARTGRSDAALAFARHLARLPASLPWDWDDQYQAPGSVCVVGVRTTLWLLNALERWDELAAFADEADFVGPIGECDRRLAAGRAAFAMQDHTQLEQHTELLRKHQKYCELQRERIEKEPRLRRRLTDPQESAKEWDQRLREIHAALSELEWQAALARGDLTEAQKRRPTLMKDRDRLDQTASPWNGIQAANARLLEDGLLWHPAPAPDWTLPGPTGDLHSLTDYRGKRLLLVLYLGAGCPHCIEQLQELAPRKADFERANLSVVTVATDSIEGLVATFQIVGARDALPYLVLSDETADVFRTYGAWSESERTPLHGVFLIDPQGRIRWGTTGKEPFMATHFLLKESTRLLDEPP